MDKHTTDVIFLLEKPDGDLPRQVFAYLPNENYYSKANIGFGKVTKDNWQDMKTCYAHVGQHSACHVSYAAECEKATEEQYQDLKKELEGLGYKLNLVDM